MKKILIVRPEERMEESMRIVESYGFEGVPAPMIKLVEKMDPEFEVFFKNLTDGTVDYVIFTSINGIRYTLTKIDDEADFKRRVNESEIVSIGEPTRRFLEGMGMSVSLVPKDFSSSGIVDALSGIDIKGKRIEILRSSHGSEILVAELKKMGANVHEVQVYSISIPDDLTSQIEVLKSAAKGEIDIFTFTSRMTVLNFLKVAGSAGIKSEILEAMDKKMVSAIGKPTEDALINNNIRVDFVPSEFTFEAMIRGLKEVT
ncbi:MAG: uroporphyrinogen-III synthase [Halobacteriota archaeon]|nr:uroporphyrinogen-III synthase [Halobacteriota archaeon]